jgi:phytoene/squalene synthetase
MPKEPTQSTPQGEQRAVPFRQFGRILQANNALRQMQSSYRVGNLMNPALMQSRWDQSNLKDGSESE